MRAAFKSAAEMHLAAHFSATRHLWRGRFLYRTQDSAPATGRATATVQMVAVKTIGSSLHIDGDTVQKAAGAVRRCFKAGAVFFIGARRVLTRVEFLTEFFYETSELSPECRASFAQPNLSAFLILGIRWCQRPTVAILPRFVFLSHCVHVFFAGFLPTKLLKTSTENFNETKLLNSN